MVPGALPFERAAGVGTSPPAAQKAGQQPQAGKAAAAPASKAAGKAIPPAKAGVQKPGERAQLDAGC